MADELEVTFTLENEPLNAEFELNNTEIDANFVINATPHKVSQIENDLNFQTADEVAASIQAESDVINARIDNEVSDLNAEIGKKVETVMGSDLIGVTREENTVTITSKTFVFEQGIASDIWEITHNLDKRPTITLVDSSGREFEAVKDYINNNQVVIRLESATTGYAYLN